MQLAQVGDGNDEGGNNDRDDSQELEEPEAVVDVGPDPLAGRQQVWSLYSNTLLWLQGQELFKDTVLVSYVKPRLSIA